MAKKKWKFERRKDKRFRVQNGAFVLLRPSDTGVGQIRDISMGGLRFDYVTDKESSIEGTELDIFVTNSSFRSYKIPCQTVWHRTIYESSLTSVSKKECGVQFGDLTDRQVSWLEHFIQKHTEGEV